MVQSSCNDLTISEGLPVKSLLHLYCTARCGHNSLYLNHFAGMKLLVEFLGVDKNSFSGIEYSLAWYETNYETGGLASILGVSESVIVQTLREIYKERRA